LVFAANAAERPASPKLSSAVELSEEPTYFLVAFQIGVDGARADRVLLDCGLERLERPDLLESQRLVKARISDLRKLIQWEEVVYIFPASEDLVVGAPVQGCAGPLLDGAPVAQYISTIGHGWDGPGRTGANLTYSISSITPSLPPEQVRALVRRALDQWSRHAAVDFAETRTPNREHNIDIGFFSGTHGDVYPFDGKGRVLAHTFYPAPVNPEPIAGDLHLDIDESWTEGGTPDFYSVVLHEIGHALGLGHSDRRGAVMYPYYRQLTALQPDDVTALQKLYGAPGPVVERPEPSPPVPPVIVEPRPPFQPPAPSSTDRTAPVLSIVSPAVASLSTASAAIRIAGTARDNGTVSSVAWQRGGDSGTAAGTANWSCEVPLLRGSNSVIIRARDAAGNTTSRTLVVTRL
jgi:hypothetical protein